MSRNAKQIDFRAKLARNIKQARNAQEPKITQADVAELFSPPLSRAAVAQWEIGETLPDLDRLAVLSKAYGVTIDSLIFGDVKDKDAKGLSPEALTVARMWQKLDARMRAATVSMIRAALEKRR